MIGKYLAGLDDAALQRVIEEPMRPGGRTNDPKDAGCLVQVATRDRFGACHGHPALVGRHFDDLCFDRPRLRRVKSERVIRAVKQRAQRILDERHAARRSPTREAVTA